LLARPGEIASAKGDASLDEYVCITVLSAPGEGRSEFAARLSRFWTHMLRNYKSDFEKVYAEKAAFEQKADRLTRQYLALDEVVPLLEAEFAKAGVHHEPVDRADTYSKYEAVAPEWMQIEH
jgi:hypothetical protein